MFSNLSGSLCEEALLLVWTRTVCHGGLKEDVTAHNEQSHSAVCLLTDLLNVQKKLLFSDSSAFRWSPPDPCNE